MTLAELQALSAFLAPQQAVGLSPVLAMVPLYAARSGRTMDVVYAMDAHEFMDGVVDVLPDLITVEMQKDAGDVCAYIKEALNPESLRKRMMALIAA